MTILLLLLGLTVLGTAFVLGFGVGRLARIKSDHTLARAAMRLADHRLLQSVLRRREDPPKTFTRGPIALRGLRLELASCDWSSEGMKLRMVVPDRDSGEPCEFTFNSTWPPVESDVEFENRVRQATGEVISHELAELLLVHGKRKDPHEWF